VKRFICDVEGCGKAIPTELGLLLHKKKLHLDPSDSSNLLPCDVPGCTKTFTSAVYVLRHKRDCHPEVVALKTGESPNFICGLEGCGRVTDTKSGLYQHHMKCHPEKCAELYKDKPYKCSCGLKFRSDKVMRNHRRKNPGDHPDYKPRSIKGENCQRCDLCDEEISYSDLPAHYKEHLGGGSDEYLVKCPNDKCPDIFLTSAGLQAHLKEKKCGEIGKEKKSGLICETCGFTTDRRLTLRNHVESLHELVGGALTKEIKCPISGCEKMFNVKQSIYFHLSTHRSKKIRMQSCDTCGEQIRMEAMEKHLKDKHGVMEVWGCKKCPFRFSGRDELVEHWGEHRPLGIFCDVCNNEVKYTRYSDFREHYFGVHQLCPKKYRCGECGVDFWTKKRKYEHDLGKHNDKRKEDKVGEGEETKKRRKFDCDMCGGGRWECWISKSNGVDKS